MERAAARTLPGPRFFRMYSAFLAAFVLGNLPVYLYPQTALPDAAWPTHATIAAPQGWIKPDQQPMLLENGQPMLAQFEVAARWPDGSPKWLHAHGAFKYVGGQPEKYTFTRVNELPATIPKSPLTVRDEADGIHIDTGTIKLLIPRPFVGISLIEHDGQPLVRGDGGPHAIDGDGTLWHTRHDREATVVVETQGPAMVRVKASGWYQTPQPRDDAFCRFTTRITVYAGSPIVKIDHATTFADDMKKHTVAELAFKFALPGATNFASATHRGTFHERLRAAYLAQLSDDRLYRVAQIGPDAERDIRHQGDYERSAGWFSTSVADRQLALLTKDFWQKCPKEVKMSPDELVYYAWPKHGDLAQPDPSATLIHNVYKFRCFHTGKLLDSNLPDDYFNALSQQTDTIESTPEVARAGNMQGVSMRNEFALVVTPPASATGDLQEHLEKLQRLYLQSPTARVSPQVIAASGVFGRVLGAEREFAENERALVEGLLGTAGSIPRYGDYGWAIYGNLHHAELMNFQIDGKRVGRPSLHRVWNNNHYQQCSTLWHAWGLNGDARLLRMARLLTDNYASIGQVRYDKQWYKKEPGDPTRRPGFRFHLPGGFYHCKALIPWGSCSYEMKATEDHAMLWGHFPDPTGLLYAWLLDADRWCLDGYDLWRENVKPPRRGTRREVNQSLVHAIAAYEYTRDDKFLTAIKGMLFGDGKSGGLLDTPIELQQPGPIWNPLWLSRAYEMFPEDQRLREFIVRSADVLELNNSGIWTLALSATAWEITGDKKYLVRHGGTLDRVKRRPFQDHTGYWQGYGAAMGPTGDGFFPLQWPRFARALRDSGVGLPPVPPEPGHYLCSSARHNRPADVAARGTRVLILGPPSEGAARKLTIDGIRFVQGDMHPASMALYDPSGKPLWNEPRMAITAGGGTRVQRPSSWTAIRDQYDAPRTPGLHTLVYASHGIGIFQGLAGGLPECQTLRNVKISDSTEKVVYSCALSQGWLVPLTEVPVVLRFTPYSRNMGSYVAVTPRGGTKREHWLVSEESVDIPLDPAEGPWYLDIYGDGTSATHVEVHSQIELPLLYGSNLEHVELIKKTILP